MRSFSHTGQPANLYVHVPFCRQRCDYCDFYSSVLGERIGPEWELPTVDADLASGAASEGTSATLDRFLRAVLAEFEMEREVLRLRRLQTVYLGGGTPSIMGEERLERLLAELGPLLTPRAEVSVETNPDDVTAGFAAWASRRRLRISLGVQSFLPRLLEVLGRRAAADPAAAFARLRRAGVRNIGLDLIFGIPGQTMGDLAQDLDQVAQLGPEHVSWYELSVEPDTPLAARLAPCAHGGSGVDARDGRDGRDAPDGSAGRGMPAFGPPDVDEVAEMYAAVVAGLERLGYRWYEVSNFARPGQRCRHNSAIWQGEAYLGLGPAAVSGFGDRRRRNLPDLHGYLAALAPLNGAAPQPPAREEEALDPATRARERLFLAARTGAPAPLADIADVLDPNALAPLLAAGFVRKSSGTLRVTRKGRMVANDLCVRLFRDSSRGTA